MKPSFLHCLGGVFAATLVLSVAGEARAQSFQSFSWSKAVAGRCSTAICFGSDGSESMNWFALEPLAEIPIGFSAISEDATATYPFAPSIGSAGGGLKVSLTGGARIELIDFGLSVGIAFTAIQIGGDMKLNYHDPTNADSVLVIPSTAFRATSPTLVVGILQDVFIFSATRYTLDNLGSRFNMLDAHGKTLSVGPGEAFSQGWAFTIGIGPVSLLRTAVAGGTLRVPQQAESHVPTQAQPSGGE